MKTGYRIFFLISLLFLTGFALSAQGNTEDFKQSLDYAQVLDVKIRQTGDTWTFTVTVRHNDEGWDHYADIWQVLHPETGEVLGERMLLHPHDTEQPFTRSQSGIVIPEEVTEVIVRAGCTVHGFGGRELHIQL